MNRSSQSIVGIYLAVAGLLGYYECAVVADPPSCEAGGAPGVRDTWVGDALAVLWLQMLVWCAFAMLPHAVHLNSTARKAAAAASSAVSAASTAAVTLTSSPPPPAPVSPPPSPPTFNDYERLSDQTSDRGSMREADAPPAAASDAGGGPKRERERSISGLFSHAAAPSSAPSKTSSQHQQQQHHHQHPAESTAAMARGAAATTTATSLSPSSPPPPTQPPPRRSRNHRFVALVKWDLACFAFCLALFAAAVVRTAGLRKSFSRATATDVWTDWRAAAAFFICIRVFFAFTAFPFMLFEVPGFAQLVARTSPTGYAPDGRIVPEDIGGFSGYVDWLQRVARGREARRHLSPRQLQLLQRATAAATSHLRLHPHEGKRLGRRRIEELDSLVASLVPHAEHPLFPTVFPDRLLCAEYKQRTHAAAGGAAADGSGGGGGAGGDASGGGGGAFGGVCGSSAVGGGGGGGGGLGLAANILPMHDRDRAAKYGVAWQSDDALPHCRLCGQKWGLLRRRHHCRACGQLVCDDCSQARVRVPGSEHLKRACDLCAAARSEGADAVAADAGSVHAGSAHDLV